MKEPGHKAANKHKQDILHAYVVPAFFGYSILIMYNLNSGTIDTSSRIQGP
ncbi:2551_t:CDS:2 [Ambispora gerdemannii]|uniref:2551_t:CDS:1 n=1 Tax=Ambispora gerdemannii TaxID=144530 RepID=A0A9N8WCN6_9GLOM|nr:2551_t:CDS:2 [Ambispora gerdemannii]